MTPRGPSKSKLGSFPPALRAPSDPFLWVPISSRRGDNVRRMSGGGTAMSRSRFVAVAAFFALAASAAADDRLPRKVDLYGELLPEGAMARMGTKQPRFKNPVVAFSV